MLSLNSKEYGDYQTPDSFASAVCEKLAAFYGLSANVILEPTFGKGNFFPGILSSFPKAKVLYGIEINEGYYKTALQRIAQISPKRTRVELFNEDIFTFDFNRIKKGISPRDSLLILGNPPWVTNTQLSALGSANLPAKSNFKKHAGLDAMTGKGNFDIAESIIIRLLSEFADYDCTLAMLCKTIVAKNIIRDANQYPFSISSMSLLTFDANDVFGVNCDAALLVIRLGKPEAKVCPVYDFDTNKKLREFGWKGSRFYSDTRGDTNIDGQCPFEWRQGIKHDCAKVMELEEVEPSLFKNGLGEMHRFQLGQYVFPLVKSSDLKSYTITKTRKFVIVPQRRVNEETSSIQHRDPAVWEYLQKHEVYLSARRSAIYKNSPRYSVFGVGDYSFSPYKVGVSGFYKEPVFSLVWGDFPVMMDDTCYFLGFSKLSKAVMTLALLNHPKCLAFLRSIAFLDSKRPYTKEVLQRIDLKKMARIVTFSEMYEFTESLRLDCTITQDDFENDRGDL